MYTNQAEKFDQIKEKAKELKVLIEYLCPFTKDTLSALGHVNLSVLFAEKALEDLDAVQREEAFKELAELGQELQPEDYTEPNHNTLGVKKAIINTVDVYDDLGNLVYQYEKPEGETSN